MVDLRLLGPIEARDAAGLVLEELLRQPKRVALLAYLAAAEPRGFHRRETLLGLFWPESPSKQARLALSQALHFLREHLGSDAIVTRGEGEVALNDAAVSCDVWALREAITQGDHAQAVALYRGALLAGFSTRASAEWEHWLDGARVRLQRTFAAALEHLALEADASGDTDRAVTLWRQLAEVDPYATRVTVRLIAALELAGDRAAALRIADQHGQRLKADLDAEPSPEVEALAQRLRAQPVPARTPAPGGSTRDRLARAVGERYRINRVLGAGGMALVYLADDLKLNRSVAIKVLRPELAAAIGTERFLTEIDIAARLAHPNILPLHDYGQADGLVYYVMPYVEGPSLKDRLTREGPLPLEEALRIAREVADALAYAHAQGIVHRDIKPANILLLAEHAVVSDFGVARAVGAATEDHALLATTGTPAYMSPEQATGSDLDGRSDLYSLGCVLQEMLTGETRCLHAAAQAAAARSPSEQTPVLSVLQERVPTWVEVALAKVLAKRPSDRFKTARQFVQALSVDQAGSSRMAARRRLSRRAVAVLAGIPAIGVAALALSWYGRAADDPGPPSPDRPYTVLATVSGSAPSWMRDAVGFLLRSGLDVSHVVQTVPSIEVERLLSLMERQATEPLDPATARELAERHGVGSVVLPRLDAFGSGLVVAVRIEDAASGQLIAETSRTAPDEEAVVATVHAVAMELRRSLGDTRAALASTEPLPLVLTASLEALRRYRDAEGLSQAVRFPEAAQAYREALTIDPAFAEARVSLAQSYNNMGFEDSATVEQQRALTTPERLRDVRRRDVEASLRFYSDYASWDESMFRSGQRTNDALRLSYFNHFDSAVTLVELEIRDEVRRVRRFDPDRQLRTEGLSWINSIGWAIASGRFEELAALRDSLAVAPTPYWLLRSSIVSGDWRRADSLRIAFPGAWFSFVFRSLDAARGRIRESHDGWSEIPALILEVVYGVPAVDAGAQLIDRRLMTVGEYVQHGVQAAFLGDTAEAKRVSTRLREARASATSALFEQSFGPLFALIDAGISMRRGDWDAAVETLAPRAKRANEPGHVFGSGTPYLVRWVLADAYTHLGEPEAAIQELDAVLQVCDDMAWHLLAYPAAHFRLGRLHAQLDNAGQAREHFVTFLDTFTDPDPDYEWMVEEARAEVERLGRGD